MTKISLVFTHKIISDFANTYCEFTTGQAFSTLTYSCLRHAQCYVQAVNDSDVPRAILFLRGTATISSPILYSNSSFPSAKQCHKLQGNRLWKVFCNRALICLSKPSPLNASQSSARSQPISLPGKCLALSPSLCCWLCHSFCTHLCTDVAYYLPLYIYLVFPTRSHSLPVQKEPNT